MKGDFSRWTFNPGKRFSEVLLQQGRVLLDSDWNEASAIGEYLRETALTDIVGVAGAPFSTGGFTLTAVDEELQMSAGRCYVDGILCENNGIGIQVGTETGLHLVYLDVWKRLITSIEDPAIQEVALGGPDSAVRVQVTWRVRSIPIKSVEIPESVLESDTRLQAWGRRLNCRGLDEWLRLTDQTGGTLTASTTPVSTRTSPCEMVAGGGYVRPDNQLYRVEVHRSGTISSATFKWSRENGSVVLPIASVDGDRITLAYSPRDAFLGFTEGNWIEICDDASELGELVEARRLYKIRAVDPGDPKIVRLDADPGVGTLRNPKLRRWDHGPDEGTENGIPINTELKQLEDGVAIRFSSGNYRAGDYWMVAARTDTGRVEWPGTDAAGVFTPQPLPAFGVRHHYAPLAIVARTARGLQVVRRCLRRFQGLATSPPALHVEDVIIGDQHFENDRVYRPHELLKGIRFQLDGPPAPVCISAATCIVVAEMPHLEPGFSSLPYALSADPRVEPVDGQAIVWAPSPAVIDWLNSPLLLEILTRAGRVLMRLKLLGRFIWSSHDEHVYLDGHAFGTSLEERNELILPSGDRRRASDFDAWFWLGVAPELLRVKGLRIFGMEGGSEPLYTMFSPEREVRVNARIISHIEVTFSHPVRAMDLGEHWDLGTEPATDLRPEAVQDGSSVWLFGFSRSGSFGIPPFRMWHFKLLAHLRSDAGHAFDGELVNLPSGDGQPGGDFEIQILFSE